MKFFLPLLIAVLLQPGIAWSEVQQLEDGAYKISGTFVYNAEKDMLLPHGKDNNYGDFYLVIFKPTSIEYPGIRDLTSPAVCVFKVTARPSTIPASGEPVLLVEQILEWEGAPQ